MRIKVNTLLLAFIGIVLSYGYLNKSTAATNPQHKYINSDELFVAPLNYLGTLSPDGKYFAYAHREEETVYINLFNIKENSYSSLVGIDKKDFHLSSYTWLAANIILLDMRKDGTDQQYLYTFSKNKTASGKIYSGKYYQLKDGYLVDSLEDDLHHVIFAKRTYVNNADTQWLYRISIEDLKRNKFVDKDKIDEAPTGLKRYVYDNGFARIVGIFSERDDEAEKNTVSLRYRDLNIEQDKKDWKTLLTFKDEDYTLNPIGFLDKNTLVVLTNQKTDKIVLQAFDIESQKLGEIFYQHENYDLTKAWLSKSGEPIAVEFVQSGIPQKEWLAASDSRLLTAYGNNFKQGFATIIARNAQHEISLLFVSGSDNPGDYYLFSETNQKLTKLKARYADLDQYSFSKTKSFKVTTNDNIEIEAYLTSPLPNALNHNALLVMPHGGPIGVRDDSSFNKRIQFLVNRGFTILQANFRGSTGYGKDFLEQGVGQFGQLIEQDISAVVEHTLQQHEFDNICVIGSSYGAYSSVMLAMKHPELYQCVVAAFGVYDLPLLFNYSNYRSGEKYSEYIARIVGENTKDKLQVSPVYRADELQAPILLIAGKLDDTSGFEQSNRMRFVLEQREKNVEHLFYKHSGHGHFNWYYDQHEIASTVDFLYRQLSFAVPQAKHLNEDNKLAIARDFALIASGFQDDDYLQKNGSSAYHYFLKASQYDHPLATFNIGAYNHRGETVNRDIFNAVDYYDRSITLGYEEAHARLAILRMFDESIPKDDEKALVHLTTAIADNDVFENQLHLSLFYCVATPANKDVDKCIKSLKATRKLSQEPEDHTAFREALGQAIVYGDYNAKERKKLAKYVSDVYELTMPNYKTTPGHIGLFKYTPNPQYGYSGKYIPLLTNNNESSKKYYGNENVYLGVSIMPSSGGRPSSQSTTVLIAVWQAEFANGQKYTVFFDTESVSSLEGMQSYLTKPKNDIKYHVTVYDLYGKIRLQHVFD